MNGPWFELVERPSARQAERVDPPGVGVELLGDRLQSGPAGAGPGSPGEAAARCRLLAQVVGGFPPRHALDHNAACSLARIASLIFTA